MALIHEAERLENEAWAWYVPRYVTEMRRSYRRNRPAWDAMLARQRVVLTCYCARRLDWPLHCHRVVLAEQCLVPCGAEYLGELEAEQRARKSVGIGDPAHGASSRQRG
jgi:hypothetical protein